MSTCAPDTVMVFAAGLGTRMRPVTDAMPKSMIPVAGKPLIDHMLDRFAEAGTARAVVNVHYLADQIETHLRARKNPEIILSDERAALLDQGGGIMKAMPHLSSGPFYICNTDALWIERRGSQPALTRFAAQWDPAEMDILLLVAQTATSVGVDWPGDFAADGAGRLAKRAEGASAPYVYAGVGIMKPELFAREKRPVFRLAPYFFDAAERGRLYGHALDGIWLHVGTPEAIKEAETAIARRRP